jgi:hypothetical protein
MNSESRASSCAKVFSENWVASNEIGPYESAVIDLGFDSPDAREDFLGERLKCEILFAKLRPFRFREVDQNLILGH